MYLTQITMLTAITWKEVAWKAQVIMYFHVIKKSCQVFPSMTGLYFRFVYISLLLIK